MWFVVGNMQLRVSYQSGQVAHYTPRLVTLPPPPPPSPPPPPPPHKRLLTPTGWLGIVWSLVASLLCCVGTVGARVAWFASPLAGRELTMSWLGDIH